MTESWSPIGAVGELAARDPWSPPIAERPASTPTQVVLRWHVQLGLSRDPEVGGTRAAMAENIAVFDFELTAEEMASISGWTGARPRSTDSDMFGH